MPSLTTSPATPRKRRGGQVLAGDGGGVEQRRDPAAGDEEVGRGAHGGHAPQSDEEGDENDGRHREGDDHDKPSAATSGPNRHKLSRAHTRVQNARNVAPTLFPGAPLRPVYSVRGDEKGCVGVCCGQLGGLWTTRHGVSSSACSARRSCQPASRVRAGYGRTASASQDTGMPSRRSVVQGREHGEHQRQAQHRREQHDQRHDRQPALGLVQLHRALGARRVQLRDPPAAAQAPAGVGQAGLRAHHRDPLVARHQTRRSERSSRPARAADSRRSRRSRAWRRLTGTSPRSVCASRPPTESLRSSRTAVQRHQETPVHADETRRAPVLLQPRDRHPHHVHPGDRMQTDVVAVRLDELDLAAAHVAGAARALDRQRGHRVRELLRTPGVPPGQHG